MEVKSLKNWIRAIFMYHVEMSPLWGDESFFFLYKDIVDVI